MMDRTLVLLGIVCLIAAIVGGGLRAFGVVVPPLASLRRQFLLGVLGLVLVVAGALVSGGDENTSNKVGPVNEITPSGGDTIAENSSANIQSDGSNTSSAEPEAPPSNTVETRPSGSSIDENSPAPEQSSAEGPAGRPATRKHLSTRQPISDEGRTARTASKNNSSAEERSADVAIADVAEALERNPPPRTYTSNQYTRGYLRFTQFNVAGLDLLVNAMFEYDRGDGTAWPPASPPVKSVDDYFCLKNPQTARLLKQQVRITVALTVIRGSNSNSFTFSVTCDSPQTQPGPSVP